MAAGEAGLPVLPMQLLSTKEKRHVLGEESALGLAVHVSFNELIPRLLLTSQLLKSPRRSEKE